MYAHIKSGRGESGTGASCTSEPPKVGGGGFLLSLAECAVFPQVTLGLGPGMERSRLILGLLRIKVPARCVAFESKRERGWYRWASAVCKALEKSGLENA